MKLDSKMTVNELLTEFPSVLDVFIKHKMPCIGCPADGFHTIEEAALMNGILLENLLKELSKVIKIKDAHKVLL